MGKKTSRLQHRLLRKLGRAIHDFSLIKENDKILVGLSGGKDSMSLFKLLIDRMPRLPIKYELIGFHVNFYDSYTHHCTNLETFCNEHEWPFQLKQTTLPEHPTQKNSNNCFWCAWNRRKILIQTAETLGCNKIALGHHLDDMVHTTLLNMFFQGEFSTMLPKQELFKGEFHIIRPLFYIEEDDLAEFAKECKFPIIHCKCPNQHHNKRIDMRETIESLKKNFPEIKNNILAATRRVNSEYLPPPLPLKKQVSGVRDKGLIFKNNSVVADPRVGQI